MTRKRGTARLRIPKWVMVVASVLLLIVSISWVILPQYSSAVRALTTLEHISFPLVLLAGILELTSLAAYSAAGVAVAALIATSACIWFLIRRTDAAALWVLLAAFGG